MELQKHEFVAWMQRLIDRFDLLEETLAKTQSRKICLMVKNYWIIKT